MPTSKENFNGLNIASLESRRADDMARMIQRHGGVAHVSPSMREVPIEPNREAIDFAYRVITGQINIVVLMTGVGFRYLLRAIERHLDQQRFLDSLSDITTICRGPKPVAAMREVGLTPNFRAPEPNTWREVLQTIDTSVPIANQVVGLQEYGMSNASLVAGLEARGASVEPLRVYGWEFPEETGPLEENVRALASGQRDMLLLTSAHQVVNMLRMAEQLQIVDQLRQGLRGTLIASIGPTTSQMLQECDLHVDMEPPHPKMGHLVIEAARRGSGITKGKAQVTSTSGQTTPIRHPSSDSLFMRACRREPTERTPVWLMRQAGRYMAEYREVRAKQSFLELCAKPDLCSEIMCTAVDRLGVDAAIIFSDLLPILVPMGFDLEFVKGDGPVIHNPIREAADLSRPPIGRSGPTRFRLRNGSSNSSGFARGDSFDRLRWCPFTLASYGIEGGGSRQYVHTKKLMHSDGGAWNALMERLSEAITVYLNHQIAAGAQCVQLFDSWAGCLSPVDYSEHVQPWVQQIIAGITAGVPVINFATGNPELLPLLRGDGRTVVGVDWRIELETAWQRIGSNRAVQGNLDPAVLLAEPETIRSRTQQLLDSVQGRQGHIFNLGHGVLKETPVEHAIALVESVKDLSQR